MAHDAEEDIGGAHVMADLEEGNPANNNNQTTKLTLSLRVGLYLFRPIFNRGFEHAAVVNAERNYDVQIAWV